MVEFTPLNNYLEVIWFENYIIGDVGTLCAENHLFIERGESC